MSATQDEERLLDVAPLSKRYSFRREALEVTFSPISDEILFWGCCACLFGGSEVVNTGICMEGGCQVFNDDRANKNKIDSCFLESTGFVGSISVRKVDRLAMTHLVK